MCMKRSPLAQLFRSSNNLRLFSLIALVLLTAAIVTPALAQDEPQYPIYIVESGDTLNSIALKFGVTTQDILGINNFDNPNFIPVGAEIKIPGYEGITGTLTTRPVELGETIVSISEQYKIPLPVLLKLNRLVSPDEIYTGSEIIYPVGGDQKPFNSSIRGEDGITPLEASVLNNLNPRFLSITHPQESSWQFLSTDVAFFDSPGDGQYANPIAREIVKFDISPLPLVQGETIIISIQTNQSANLQGSLNGSELHFFSDTDHQYYALQGIHAMAEPGLSDFTLSGKFSDGHEFSFSQKLILKAGNFSKDPVLYVDPATIDPENTKPEEELIQSVIKNATPERMWKNQFSLPVDEPFCIYSYFGNRRSYNGGEYKNFHTGLDFGVCATLNIYSPTPGIVVFAGPQTVRGNLVLIDHGWGVYSGFYHMKDIQVKVGDRVETGTIIGTIGDTGRVTGPHLHYEIWVNGVQVNPETWLFDRVYP